MTTPTIQPVGSPVDAARVGPSAAREVPPLPASALTCRHCGREVVLTCYGPGHTVAFARKSDADRHRATPRSSSLGAAAASPPGFATAPRSEDLLTPGGEAVVSGRRASANP